MIKLEGGKLLIFLCREMSRGKKQSQTLLHLKDMYFSLKYSGFE